VPPRSLRLYLSASIANGPLNARLAEQLGRAGAELVLPQDFAPDVPHAHLPRAIYQRCIDEMERCDAGLLLLDAYGIDCAFEAGWFAARGKPLVGLAQANLRFLQNWMVKGVLTGVATSSPTVAEALRRDPMLASISLLEAESERAMVAALPAFVRSLGPPGDDLVAPTGS
jgi:nucleoside 2-deoxyribosyltransferase